MQTLNEDQFYLKQNIQVEPLVNGWYAWFHLIPPATSALNFLERHVAIMESYVDAPLLHAAAVCNPAMRGGPFIDLKGKRVDEVSCLLEDSTEKNQHIIEFARAIRELQHLLINKAKGQSLESLYQEVPEILRGYVELAYDLFNNPTFRFFESLLYKSPYYAIASQSVRLSEIVKDADRPFILSTPRLNEKGNVNLTIPFKTAALDDLFRMKKTAGSVDRLVKELEVGAEEEKIFRAFFTKEEPAIYEGYNGKDMRIRYFGHACILIESNGVSILMDPVLSYTYESDISRYTYEDLPDTIDYVLISHSHQDHILLETMLQLRHKVKNIIVGSNIDGALQDPSLKLAFQNMGFKQVIELREFDEITFPGGSITTLPFLGEHHDLLIHSKLGYLIKIQDRTVLSIADSCNIEPKLYERVYELIGDVDVLFLGMECEGSPPSWVYGPLFPAPIQREFDQTRRGRGCDFNEGMDIIRRFNCTEVFVYAMGLEPWLRYILGLQFSEESHPMMQARKLVSVCQSEGRNAELLFGEKEICKLNNAPETV